MMKISSHNLQKNPGLSPFGSKSTSRTPNRIICLFLLLSALGIWFLWTFNNKESMPIGKVDAMDKVNSEPNSKNHKATIVSGQVAGVSYYHCAADKILSSHQHLVLLHGAKFTKEDWKTSGILDRFCGVGTSSVMALDLPVSADHAALQAVLKDLQPLHVTLPVVLVTPSASGKTIVDWIRKGDTSELPSMVSHWIPVAAGSLQQATDEQLASLESLRGFSIFAIYGNQDTMGKEVSMRLGSLAGADVLEIQGGHPCYLDSPDAFVAEILKHVGI